MADRYFSQAEVEALIPALTGIMKDVMDTHAEAGEVRERMRAEQRRIAMAGGGVFDREAWQANRTRLETLVARLRKGLDRIAELGGVPKDLGLGLVDFPHLREGAEVSLCWKHGEREIRYWHGPDEGFAGRKPL